MADPSCPIPKKDKRIVREHVLIQRNDDEDRTAVTHYDSCIDLAKKDGAKIHCCTHHEPSRNDDALEQEFENVLARHPRRNAEPEYRLAREGEEIEI